MLAFTLSTCYQPLTHIYYCLPHLSYLGIMSQIQNLLHFIKRMEELHIELLDGWGRMGIQLSQT